MSQAAVQHQQQPPHTTQQYPKSDRYATSGNPSSSPTSRRPAGNASLPNTPQPSQTMTTPRGSSAGAHVSPSAAMSPSTYSQYYPDQTPLAAALPIRTSSQQTPTTTPSHDGRTYTSRGQSAYGGESDSDRRRSHRSPREEPPNSGKSQRSRHAPTTSRSTTAIGQPPMGTDLPRENSAVINRIVVDDPQADLIREEIRKAEGRPHAPGADITPIQGLSLVPDQGVPDAVPAQRSRQEHLKHSSQHRKEVKFGDYFLGQTLGEGEFGKVKMGWKKDSTVQVAIKLIRKESLAGNTTRLPKIYREIAILRELQHPNIVRLHEFVETERHMGIILEYASGGELFDYILNQRYLKDPAARRLFAQLVSGVGYLHKKGIVHRDLKLENLLLDRNKHIIITDFGFANTFDPNDELGDDVEARIGDKDYIKQAGLDKVIPWRDSREGGHRRGDLMQTSCGSPCYAAPELVVSDGLYTGRKVDVWSCGVILYAMLAGYLPFDDDPANPEGDNINLLYKYIVSTPLTFPDYVTPHARDLLRRILVPDPRRRADLFEVARHSWLSEYTHVVGFIGSKVKSEKDIAAASAHDDEDAALGRSASVREPPARSPAEKAVSNRTRHAPAASVGGEDAGDLQTKQKGNVKRNTIQLEYQSPNTHHPRTQASPLSSVQPSGAVPIANTAAKTRTRTDGGPVEITPSQQSSRRQETTMAPPLSRPGRDQQRAASETTNAFGKQPASNSRPNTGGTLTGTARLPSRGNSYSQPSVAQPTTTTAQGSISQPKPTSGYIISSPISSEQGGLDQVGRPMSQQNRLGSPASGQQPIQPPAKRNGHRRTSTWGSITEKLTRSNSRRASQQQDSPAAPVEKRDRRFPPVSMRNALPGGVEESTPRPSSESRRPSFGFSRKASREREPSVQGRRSSRRFSFLPANFSMSSFTTKKDSGYDSGVDDSRRQGDPYQQPPMSQHSGNGRPESKGMSFGRGTSRSPSGTRIQRRSQQPSAKFDKALPASPLDQHPYGGRQGAPPAQHDTPPPVQRKQFRDDGYGSNLLDQQQQQQQSSQPSRPLQQGEPVERFYTPSQDPPSSSAGPRLDQYSSGSGGGYPQYDQDGPQGLRPQQRRFDDAYEQGHGGSSSATKRVMDFFRRRGKERDA